MTATETAILPVLAELGLQRIVQVDDANVEEVDFNHVWENCSALSELQWQTLGVALEGRPPEDWRGAVEGHWNSLDAAGQKLFAGGALAACGRLDAEKQDADTRFQAALRKLFPGTALESMPLAAWRSKGAALIDEAKTTPTLFLFDLHFEREDAVERQGVQLLKDNKDHEHVILGILSHDPSLEDEPAAWAAISEEAQVAKARFVVLSKKRMTTDDPSLLLDGFRRTVLVKVVEQVKQTCQAILDPSIERAKKAINDINVYDFDQAIFRSSRIEGVWEGDTYFRLFNATVRQHAQKAMHGHGALRTHIAEIRRKFPHTEVIDSSVRRNAWTLRRAEIYEDPAFVNEHLLPVANGDIFQVRSKAHFKDDKDDLFVLVVQPCDLAVRDDGLRGGESGEPKFADMAYLVQIPGPEKPIPGHSDLANVEAYDKLRKRLLRAEGRPSARFELPYFDLKNPDVRRYLSVSSLHHVWLAALDLSALNASGEAVLPLDVAHTHELLLPGWTTRTTKMQKHFRDLLALVPAGLEQAKERALIGALVPAACRSRTILTEVSGAEGARVVKYGIKRVGRLAPDQAAALLGRVAAHMSRPAFEHDLAREGNSAE